MVDEITDATFEEETSEGVVLIDFWATWKSCGSQYFANDAQRSIPPTGAGLCILGI